MNKNERIAQLEERLAAAERRIADLEARPRYYWPRPYRPYPYDPWPWGPYYGATSTSDGTSLTSNAKIPSSLADLSDMLKDVEMPTYTSDGSYPKDSITFSMVNPGDRITS